MGQNLWSCYLGPDSAGTVQKIISACILPLFKHDGHCCMANVTQSCMTKISEDFTNHNNKKNIAVVRENIFI